MDKPRPPKLSLNTEKLRKLNEVQLATAGGGAYTYGDYCVATVNTKGSSGTCP